MADFKVKNPNIKIGVTKKEFTKPKEQEPKKENK